MIPNHEILVFWQSPSSVSCHPSKTHIVNHVVTLPAFRVSTEAACGGKKLLVHLFVPFAAHLFLKPHRGLCPCPLQSTYMSALLVTFIFLWLEKLVEGIQGVSRQPTWHEHCQGLMASSFKPCLEMGSVLYPPPPDCLFLFFCFFFKDFAILLSIVLGKFPKWRCPGESQERRGRSTLKLLRRWGRVPPGEVWRVWHTKGVLWDSNCSAARVHSEE